MNGSSTLWIFVAVAAAILVVFGASLYWAGARGKNGGTRRQSLWLALSVPLVVGGLYAVRGETAALNPHQPDPTQSATQQSGTQQPAHDMADMAKKVQGLADRLKQHPEDLDGWLLLARSYTMMGRDADAAAAYEHAKPRVIQDSGLLVSWISLRLSLNKEKFDAPTLELLDRAAKLSPDDSNVMLLSAMAAFDRGDKAGANVLVGKLHVRYPQGSPERKDLDAALEKWTSNTPGKQ